MSTNQSEETINFTKRKIRVETGHRNFKGVTDPYSIGPFVNIEKKGSFETKTKNEIKVGTIYIAVYFNELVGPLIPGGYKDTDVSIEYKNCCEEYGIIEIVNKQHIKGNIDNRCLWELVLIPKTEDDIKKIQKLREIEIRVNFNEDLQEPNRATRVIPT